jgi:MoxR-like ATPase
VTRAVPAADGSSSQAVDVVDVDTVTRLLAEQGYLADPHTATVATLAVALGRPILAEGPPGTGKTQLAVCLAAALGRRLIRLQCHEELDEARSLYEWDYGRQMLAVQLLRPRLDEELTSSGGDLDAALASTAGIEQLFFSERFVVERPLLAAVRSAEPVLLLVDEVDRADEAFEALLLEVLGEQQLTIPELGTIRAGAPIAAVITSNDSRELSDALRRRCLRLGFSHPDPVREAAIVEAVVPDVGAELRNSIVAFLGGLRALGLRKPPGISETLDWARALVLLGADTLDADLVRSTLGLVVKHAADEALVAPRVPDLLAGSR